MANYLDKWKTDFPETVNNQTRPAAGIDNSLAFNTDGFPQRITSDPVHAKLENDMAQQLFSNDQRLKEAIDSAGIKESNHEKDSNAHANGIAGNAGSATKLATARTIQTNLASTSAASFNGTTNITPGVTGTLPVGNGGTGQTNLDNVTVGTSKKVHTTVSAGAVGEVLKATMGDSDAFRIAVGGSSNAGYAEIATAGDGTEPIYVRQYGDAKSDGFVTPTRTATLLDANGNTQFPGSVTAPSFVGNAASADKWKTARTLFLGGRASGSVSMDGSANVTLNVNNVSLADKATADANGNNISSTYVKSVVNLTTEDLNNICKGGFYQNSLNVNSTSARHYPVDQHACSIIVANNGVNGENSCTQICTLFDTHDSYKREYEASTKTWSSWRKYAFVDSTVAKASQLATARTISLTGNATGAASFDGSGNISINTTVSNAAHAEKAKVLDGFTDTDTGTWGKAPGTIIGGMNETGGGAIQWRTTRAELYEQINGTYWQREGAYEVIDTSTVNNYAPTKTGSGASGTWDISISGNADTVDGYHASDIIGKIYPVGSIYMSMSATDPATLFGVGTWERISQGRMLLGADDSTYEAGATGGEAAHTLSMNEMPAHSHNISNSGNHTHYFYGSNSNNGQFTEGDGIDTEGNSHSTNNERFLTSSAGYHTHTISNSGGGKAHNNMPPYLVCYIWQRTA